MGYRKTGDFLERVAEEGARKGRKPRGAPRRDAERESGRVLAAFGLQCLVRFADRELRFPASRALSPVTGDLVETDGRRVINILPRGKVLARADANSTQVIAANIDRVVLVQSASHPPFREGLTDRYRVFTQIMDLPLILVLNKIERARDGYQKIVDACRESGIEVVPVSAKTGQGMDDLADRLRSGISVFSGHSGVGKSSLLSYWMPGVRIRVGELSPIRQLGRQQTTTTRAYPFGDGFLIDTPGIRQFGFVGVNPCDVSRAFPEIMELSSECRFRNCLHITEPDCAVKRAVDENRLAHKRYRSYHNIVVSVKT